MLFRNEILYIDNAIGLGYNKYNGQKYVYRKNLQGDIVAILDECGCTRGTYEYDAWGNIIWQGGSELLTINPFRYRGYYYDTETGLYYLNSRYYDPETGRFISPDSLKYLVPETCNGLNLYAYCGNNPVMFVDPNGTLFGFFLGTIVLGAVIGGTINGISAYNAGQRGLGLFGAIAGGAVMGGSMAGILALGGVVGLASTGLISFGITAGAAFGISLGVGAAAGMVSYSLEYGLRSDREWSVGEMLKSGLAGLAKSAVTFGIGFLGGKSGAFDKLFLKELLGKELVKDSVSYGIAKGLIAAASPGFLRNLFTWSSFYFGETLTKFLFVSSVASGLRWIIDQIFGV